ncbi:hypothetical protein F5148DRAFT_1247343, partial [Russula earlei]
MDGTPGAVHCCEGSAPRRSSRATCLPCAGRARGRKSNRSVTGATGHFVGRPPAIGICSEVYRAIRHRATTFWSSCGRPPSGRILRAILPGWMSLLRLLSSWHLVSSTFCTILIISLQAPCLPYCHSHLVSLTSYDILNSLQITGPAILNSRFFQASLSNSFRSFLGNDVALYCECESRASTIAALAADLVTAAQSACVALRTVTGRFESFH